MNFDVESVSVDELKPHPRNYREHLREQLDHIKASIKKHGVYKNIVIARDGTILAGHGVVEAARDAGLEEVPVRRLDVDPDSPQALKILIGDNEIEHLAHRDDRVLTNILREVRHDGGLAGTGHDDESLADLIYDTRAASEIEDLADAARWVGVEDVNPDSKVKLILMFKGLEAWRDFCDAAGINPTPKPGKINWPPKE